MIIEERHKPRSGCARFMTRPAGRTRLLALVLLTAVIAFGLTAGALPSGALAQDAENPEAALRASSFSGLMKKAAAGEGVPVIIGLNVKHAPGRPDNQGIANAQERVLAALTGMKVQNVKKYKNTPQMALLVDSKTLTALEKNPLVSNVWEDKLNTPSLNQSRPLIGADQAWANTPPWKGAGKIVAILDTGVDTTHPFFAGGLAAQGCFSTSMSPGFYNINGSASFCPGGFHMSNQAGSGMNCGVTGCEHGTHVAGIALGLDPFGPYSGVAISSVYISVQVFSQFTGATSDCKNPDGSTGVSPCVKAWDSDVIAGLDYIYNLALGNPNLIAAANLSLGGGVYSANCDSISPYTFSIENLKAQNVATVIAAGNDGSAVGISHPACVSSAISVGSTTKSDGVSVFTNSHAILDLWAPGSSITSTLPGGGTGVKSGTSMAAPHVAGAWAIIRQAAPDMSVDQVLQKLQLTGTPITDPLNGVTKPRINVFAAAKAAYGVIDGDMDGDRAGDIVWKNTVNGATAVWSLSWNGAAISVAGGPAITQFNGNWDNSGIGDFDGDGVNDIVWRNKVNGANRIWFMNTDGSIKGGAAAPTLSVTSGWDIAAVGDLDGDGMADLVWRNYKNGANSVWLMNGAVKKQGLSLTALSLSSKWDIVGAGDVNGDGMADIIIRNTGTGKLNIWFMNRNQKLSAATVDTFSIVWSVGGMTDVDGDGVSDIILRRTTDGRVTIWFLNPNGSRRQAAAAGTWGNYNWMIAND